MRGLCIWGKVIICAITNFRGFLSSFIFRPLGALGTCTMCLGGCRSAGVHGVAARGNYFVAQ